MDYWVVISGVLSFVVGQAVLRFVFEPIQMFNRERGDMSFLLVYFSSSMADRTKRIKDDDYNLGLIGASLVACAAQIPFYNALVLLGVFHLPSSRDLMSAAIASVAVSDSIKKSSEDKSVDDELAKIAKLLKIQAVARAQPVSS